MEFLTAILLCSEPVVGGGLIFILGLLFWVAYTFYYFRNHYITNNLTNDDLKDMRICLQEKRIFVRSEVEQLRSGFYFNEYFLKSWKKT